jgi:hypothetical protein
MVKIDESAPSEVEGTSLVLGRIRGVVSKNWQGGQVEVSRIVLKIVLVLEYLRVAPINCREKIDDWSRDCSLSLSMSAFLTVQMRFANVQHTWFTSFARMPSWRMPNFSPAVTIALYTACPSLAGPQSS